MRTLSNKRQQEGRKEGGRVRQKDKRAEKPGTKEALAKLCPFFLVLLSPSFTAPCICSHGDHNRKRQEQHEKPQKINNLRDSDDSHCFVLPCSSEGGGRSKETNGVADGKER